MRSSPPSTCALSNRKHPFQFVSGSLRAVLIQLERLGVLDRASLLIAIELHEQTPVLIGDARAVLLDGVEQERLTARLVGGYVRAVARLPRICVAELRRPRPDAFP